MAGFLDALQKEGLNVNAPPQDSATGSGFRAALAAEGLPLDAALKDNALPQVSLNPATGEQRPSYANGLSFDAPINQSPLSTEDRLKLSFSNEAGRQRFLRQRFDGVIKNDAGDWVVKHEGLWHRVDADAFGDKDPWEVTKGVLKGDPAAIADMSHAMSETVGDIADIAKEGTIVGATLAAGLIAAPVAAGAGAIGLIKAAATQGVIAAGAAGYGSILGRLSGTYEATTQDTVLDLTGEALLNAGGTVIGAAVKPTFKMLFSGMHKIGAGLSRFPKNLLESMTAITGAGGKVTRESAEMAIENPGLIRRMGLSIASKVGDNIDDLMTEATVRQQASVKGAAKALNAAVQGFYKQFVNKIGDAVPDTYISKPAMLAVDAVKLMHRNGFAKFVDAAGKEVPIEEIVELASKGPLPKAIKLSFASMDDVINMANRNPAIAAPTDEVYDGMVKLVKSIADRNLYKASIPGKAGAISMVDTRSGLRSLTKDVRFAQGIPTELRNFAAELHATLDASLSNHFRRVAVAGGGTLDETYRAGKATYSSLRSQFKPYIEAVQKGEGSREVWESLTKKLQTAWGANAQVKHGWKTAVEAVKEFDPSAAAQIVKMQRDVAVLQAVKDFAPIVRPGLLGMAQSVGAVGSAAVGDVKTVVRAGGPLAMTSPKVSFALAKIAHAWNNFVETSSKETVDLVSKVLGSREAAQTLMSFKNAAAAKGRKALIKAYSDPDVLETIWRSTLQAPAMKELSESAVQQFIAEKEGSNGNR